MIDIIAYMAVIALVVLVFVVAISILIHELPTILRDIEDIKEILDEWKGKKQKGAVIDNNKEEPFQCAEFKRKEDAVIYWAMLKERGIDAYIVGVEE